MNDNTIIIYLDWWINYIIQNVEYIYIQCICENMLQSQQFANDNPWFNDCLCYDSVSLHWYISHVLPISYPGVLYEIFVNMVAMTVILIILSYIFHYIFLDTSAGGVLISYQMYRLSNKNVAIISDLVCTTHLFQE
jgi:hypothetical protein